MFVLDACHSAGMARGGMQGRLRAGGYFGTARGSEENSRADIPALGDEAPLPKHVTLITAVEYDHQKVYETTFGEKRHGALSYFFAQALSGKADGNENQSLERSELERFLVKNVKDHMEMTQFPKLLPRGDTTPVLKIVAAMAIVF